MFMKNTTSWLIFSLLTVCFLANCGGGGGNGSASSEETKNVNLYFPNAVQYEDGNEVLQESATMGVVFGDQNLTVSTSIYSNSNGSSDMKTLIAKKEVVLDYSGNVLSDETDISLNSSSQTVEYTYDKESTYTIKKAYTVINGVESTTPLSSEEIDYTSDGKVSKRIYFNGDNTGQSPSSYTTYTYNDSGQISEEDIYSDAADLTTPTEKHIYTYDNNGNKTLESSYSWNTGNKTWNNTPDWSDSWSYHYTNGLPDGVQYWKGSGSAVGTPTEYTTIIWTEYSAPSQASSLQNLTIDDIEGMFLSSQGTPTVPGVSN